MDGHFQQAPWADAAISPHADSAASDCEVCRDRPPAEVLPVRVAALRDQAAQTMHFQWAGFAQQRHAVCSAWPGRQSPCWNKLLQRAWTHNRLPQLSG